MLGAKGGFSVSWTLVESYVDFWGSYVVDAANDAIVLKVDGGNHVPADFDGQGTFSASANELVLRQLWLGSPSGSKVDPIPCAQVFARF